jgi:siroheme synthase
VERLIAHGAPAERAAALIERATLPDQRVVSGSLYDIDARARQAHISAPALLVVGDTVPGMLKAGSSGAAATGVHLSGE